MAKISTPDTPMGTWSILNGYPATGTDPGGIDRMTDRLATGCRRMPIPATMGRGRAKTYDDSIWQRTVVVPPWTKALGLRARGVCSKDAENQAANVALHYRYSGDGWERYVVFSQQVHGKEAGQDYDDVLGLPWASTFGEPMSGDVVGRPLPVTADDEPQELTVEFKLETDLDFNLYEYQLYVIPYDMEAFADLP